MYLMYVTSTHTTAAVPCPTVWPILQGHTQLLSTCRHFQTYITPSSLCHR